MCPRNDRKEIRINDKTMKKMKLWSILMLMVMALPMVEACSSDNDDNNRLVGTWTTEWSVVDRNTVKTQTVYLTFTSDLKASEKIYEGEKLVSISTGTYKIINDVLSIQWDSDGDTYNWVYSIKGNKLYVSFDGIPIEFTRIK